MARKNKIDFRTLLVEALLIVFTVLLALALNEWRNSVKEAETKALVIQNITSEIRANQQTLESVMDYHKEVSGKLGQYLGSDSLWATLPQANSIIMVTSMLDKGILPPQLQEGAWKSAELSGIVNTFKFRTLYNLSNLYNLQRSGAQTTWRMIAEKFTDPTYYRNDNARELASMFQVAFGELYSQEQSLYISYKNILNYLEKDLNEE